MIANATDRLEALKSDPSYQELKRLTRTNQLLIYYIFSLPRSLSTALQIAITEGADAQINEPFFHADHNTVRYDSPLEDNFHSGCKLVLNYVKELLADRQELEVPLKLVLNDIVGDLTENEFDLLLSIGSHFAITMRDPASQMKSFWVRLGNDYHTLCGTALDDTAALEQCLKPEAVKEIEKGVSVNQNSWLNIERYTQKLIDHVTKTPGTTLAIIDGYMLQMAPKSLMQQLCLKWDMPFTENMVNNWQKVKANGFYSPVSFDLPKGLTNGWHARAINSKGFEAPKDEKIDGTFFEIIPDKYKKCVTEAEKIYYEIMQGAHVILPQDPAAIEKIKKNNLFLNNVLDAHSPRPSRTYCLSYAMNSERDGDKAVGKDNRLEPNQGASFTRHKLRH